jgi:uncharacterized membrane protein YkoI
MIGWLAATIGLWGAAAAYADAPVAAGLIGMTRAVTIAEQRVSARAMEAELDADGAVPVYEIKLVRGGVLHKAVIDARSGRTLSITHPRIEGAWRTWFDRERMRHGERARSLSQTLAGVERQTHGHVREVDFEVEGGHAMYEIDVATAAGSAKMHVDAVSGIRLAVRHDD